MKPTEYVENVLFTESRDMAPLKERFSAERNIRLLHAAIGLASELAEVREIADHAQVSPNWKIDLVNLKEEMGDMFWYMGVAADALGLDPEMIFADRVGNKVPEDFQRLELAMSVDEMTKEIGYAIDMLKKSVMYGREIDVDAFANRLMALDAEICAALDIFGITPGEARQANIDKLRKKRYKNGFSEAAALNRDIAAEREILEKK